MKEKENLIHVKLDFDEALVSKRDVLLTESYLIKMAKAIRAYRDLRTKELTSKIELDGKMKEIKHDIRNLKSILPIIELPKIVKEFEEKKHHKVKKKKEQKKVKNLPKRGQIKEEKKEVIKEKEGDNLELQLKEIQSRLEKIS